MPYLEESSKSDQAHDSVLQNHQANILVILPHMLHCLQALLNHQPQGGVQEAQREHPLCNLARCIHTAQLYLKLLKHLNLDKLWLLNS